MNTVLLCLRAVLCGGTIRRTAIGIVLASIGSASTAQAQWMHRWNQVATAAPVYGDPAHSWMPPTTHASISPAPASKQPVFASSQPARVSSQAAHASTPPAHASIPTVAYGGHGPRARVLQPPGAAVWSQPKRSPVEFASQGPDVIQPSFSPYRQAASSGQGSLSLPADYGQPYGAYGCAEADTCCEAWSWQLVPEGLIYPNYLAGVKEPRMGALLNYEDNDGWKWDLSIGGRFGVVRYGTLDANGGEGWQLDVEAAAQPRLDPEENMDLEATDYRFGVPLTYGCGRYRMKIAYFHLSSHLGDEFAIRNGLGGRINYSRDAILWGHSYQITESLTGYCELGFGFKTDVNEPWDLQFGFDYSPPCECGFRGAPFFAANAHLREEVDFGGNGVIQAGWQWRSRHEGHLLRVGAQYYNGKHERYEFFDTSEQKVGLGIWYDF